MPLCCVVDRVVTADSPTQAGIGHAVSKLREGTAVTGDSGRANQDGQQDLHLG